ncbi:hypothetical protein M878_20600 [Streptomyces roseochromogenus subsp. oscitans DS 12.976]|uniref:Uncharacterized protein n=1 Tax=Streptomyces roseochromogenus subsp. oscitans DS 12.976 TaxID=1352936 RepID=V6KKG9_STRRC|nr:hypothetical protein M878_20600 [Streptomyces roseochromogenus subsp. oscitans DS 12.976]
MYFLAPLPATQAFVALSTAVLPYSLLPGRRLR